MTAGGRIYPSDAGAIHAAATPDANPAVIDVRTIDLSIARNKEELKLGDCSFIWVMDATDTDANLSVSASQQWNGGIPLRKGMRVSGIDFSHLWLTNAAQAGKTLTIMFTRKEAVGIDNAAEPVTATKPTIPTQWTNYYTLASATGTTAIGLAANANRAQAVICNDDAVNSVYITSNSGATGAEGIKLAPGATLFVETSLALYCRNDSGASVNVLFSEIVY